MKEFLLKHKKVVFFGIVLAAVFLIIISLSADRSGTPITLTQFITRDRDEAASTFVPPLVSSPEPTQPTTATSTSPPPTYPDLVIAFIVGSGWTPGSKNGNVGQKVIWRNDSVENIVLMELFPKTSAIANGVTLTPGATAEIILSESSLFTYRELNSGSTGRVFVAE